MINREYAVDRLTPFALNEGEKLMKKQFIMVDGWMFSLLGLSGNEILVFALIYSYCVRGKGIFYGSISKLAETVNLSRRSMSGIIARLIRKGLLCRETVGEYDGYVVHVDPEVYPGTEGVMSNARAWAGKSDVDNCRQTVDNSVEDSESAVCTDVKDESPCTRVCEESSRTCEESSHESGKNLPTYKKHINKTEKRINNKENENILPALYPAESEPERSAGGCGCESRCVRPSRDEMREEFEQLWQLYPQARRRGKSKALRAYELSRTGGTPFESIRRGLDEYVKMLKRENVGERFVKLCVNFFKEEAWMDDFANFRFRLATNAEKNSACAEQRPAKLNRALDYKQRTYTLEDLKANGISLGEEVYQ